jgi:adenine/guanine phosphoribosyltransferase-like PRPP-binding protein
MIKELERYIDNINQSCKFDKSNIVVEHRSNNPKRDFLFVNKVQGKHIPCRPSETINMCRELATEINKTVGDTEKVLVVGFAETATAIANIVADNMYSDCYVMQTTREEIEHGRELLNFEEEHSHATTQKLMTYKNTEKAVDFTKFTYVLFIDDEISTGNTIINFLKAFNKTFDTKLKFGVASVCNWQDENNRKLFKDLGIDTFCLLSGQLKDKDMKMFSSEENINMVDSFDARLSVEYEKSDKYADSKPFILRYNIETVGGGSENMFSTERLGHKTNRDVFDIYCKVKDMIDKYYITTFEKIRIIGTEEFMYIPIMIGKFLENYGFDVKCHATTRSSIDVVTDDERSVYEMKGITNKVELPSIYERGRETFIYNTYGWGEDTLLLLITDTEPDEKTLEIYNRFFGMTTQGTYAIIVI